jgi:citrate lyase subunit beta/citryl-CoA lyase
VSSAVATARSFLFVPGDRPDRFDRAVASGADVVVIDLEDAVSQENKALARSHVVSWLALGRRALVRVNGTESQHHEQDCAALAGAPGLQGVILPKATSSPDVDALRSLLSGAPVVALVEHAAGLAHVDDLAAAQGVERLALGTVDLAIDLDCEDTWEAMLLARANLVLASRAAGLPPPVDGVTLTLDNGDAAGAAARRARGLGFGGKLCIHPRQVPPVNAAFTPTSADEEWAAGVLAASASGGATTYRGELVDEPVARRARRILERRRAAHNPNRQELL